MGVRLQALNDRLANELNDPVSNYADNGLSYSSSDRDNLINASSRLLYNAFFDNYRLIVRKLRGETNLDIAKGFDLLSDFIPAPAVFTPSLVVSFPEDSQNGYGILISSISSRLKNILHVVDNQSPKRTYEILEKQDILKVFSGISRFRANNYAPKCWITTKSGSDYLRLYPMLSVQNVWVSFLEYPDTSLTSAGAPDLQWRTEFDDTLIKIATAFALLYNGEPDKYQVLVQMCLSNYGLAAQIINTVAAEEQQKAAP